MPGAVLSIFVYYHLLRTTLEVDKSHYPYSADEETEAEKAQATYALKIECTASLTFSRRP